jgi:hypothetical protein
MVRPSEFGPDAETATDNAFQALEPDFDPEAIQSLALNEFDAVQEKLVAFGIDVSAFDGKPGLPDEVFPNNWFTTFEDGTLVLYPLKALIRRGERRGDIVDWLLARYPQLIDMSAYEDKEMFLEGTGSLVLDRGNHIAFAGRSERTNEQLLRNWCADLEYDLILFDTAGPGGKPIYHTNVLLSLGTGYCIVCTECIMNPAPVISALLATGREVIEITRGQMTSFCANVLELESDRKLLAMSSTAGRSYSATQLEAIRRYAEVVEFDIPTIEKYGGGGIRCMLAELF